jgi:ABC-type antimicrobial peptide transport system permease subunit
LLSIFGAIALLLAAIGVYGVMALLVTQRTREIGVRMALGATRGGIMSLVLSSAAGWTLAGIAAGVLSSLAAARAIRSLIFGVPQFDTVAMTASVGVLLCAALLAAYVPARRAARVDPMIALRHE